MSNPNASIDATVLERLSRAEQRLEHLSAEAAESSRLATLGLMSTILSHEIRNALTPVGNYARLALDHPDDADLSRKALEKTANAVDLARHILDSTLDFATGEGSGEVVANVQTCLDLAVATLPREPEKDHVRVISRVPPGTMIAMEPTALQQVFINLLLNAVSAMRHGGGEIHIGTAPAPGGALRLMVSDDGPGFPPDLAGSIFEAFVTQKQNPEDRVSGLGGIGLGLMICRRLVEQAGGSIAVDSKPEDGATFTMTLPRAQPMSKAG